MREIKFRAWDKEENRMYDWPFIIHHFDDEIRVHKEGFGYIHIPMEDIDLMQYTGIEDKNGKEIYEGDILRAKMQGDWYVGEVNFGEGMWFGAKDYLYQAVKNEAEVIGNIYENPELIK